MLKVNGKQFITEYFPDGTLRLKLEEKSQHADIEWLYENNEEMIVLYFITNHLRRVNKVKTLNLIMPYIPNARMDRVKKSDEVFTLKYFIEFINSLKFENVYVRDAHSNVSLALIDNVVSEDITSKIKKLADDLLKDDDIVFFPDEGSYKRYSDIINKKCAFGIKKRDWRTGEIQGLDINGDIPKGSFNALIIDDICSYGGTFYYSAKKLKELGADKIWLYITHCENSVLKGDLIKSGLVEKIYTTKSILTMKHDLIEEI